jgi:hypothetical protein
MRFISIVLVGKKPSFLIVANVRFCLGVDLLLWLDSDKSGPVAVPKGLLGRPGWCYKQHTDQWEFLFFEQPQCRSCDS